MPDRSNRSQRGGGFISISGLTPPELPDYQGDLNKQLSFLKSMDAYMNGGGGGGGGTIRNANGLTPYQQAQLDYKLKKDAEKAAAEEAKKNVVLGVNPKTGEPIIYRNESGYKLSDKRVSELYGQALDTELRKDIANDGELNRINGILFGPKPISIAYRKDLERQARDRTKALASIYKIDDRTAFDAVFGDQSKAIRNEQQKALKDESFLDVLGAGIAQGWSDFVDAVKMPTQSAEERLETGREAIRKRNERIAASPTLREREMREQEAAERGEEIGYWEATGQNRPSNFAASVAGTLTSFAPAIAVGAGLAPITGGASLAGIPVATGGAALATGYLGAGMNQLGQAQRAAQDPNLTEEQRRAALSMDDSGFATTSLVGGAAGMLMPGSVSGGVTRMAGKYLGDASAKGIRGVLGRAGEQVAKRAKEGRSLGTLARDIAVNSGENAAIMGANTVGANAAYNMSTGQPLTQGVTQGALGAIGEGAVIGVPFGGARTLRRARVPRAETPAGTVETPATTSPETPAETPATTPPATTPPATTPPATTPPATTPSSGVTPTDITWAHKLRADENFRKWEKSLVEATHKPVDKSASEVDKVVAEYLAGGGRIEDLELIRDSFTRKGENYISDEEFAKTHNGLAHLRSDSIVWTDVSSKELANAITRWKEASSRGELNEKIAGTFPKQPGESRVASILAELKPEREGGAAGSGNNTDSPVETGAGKNATDVADGAPVPDSTVSPELTGKRLSGTESQNDGPSEVHTADASEKTAEQPPVVPATDLRGAGEGGLGTRDGTRVQPNQTVGRDGGPGDAAANSRQKQSVGEPVITYRPNGTHTFDYAPRHDVLEVEGKTGKSVFFRKKGEKLWRVYNPDAKKFYSVASRDVWNNLPDDIREIGKNYSTKNGGAAIKVMSKALTEIADNEAAKSANQKSEVKESRVLPRQKYTSAGTSRKQIPESFKKIPWKKGTRNLDIGAGKHELGTDYLRSKGVENVPFDPYNRSTDVNNAALNTLRNGEKFDTVTVANLLNVVQEPEIRDNIIKQAAHALKSDGKAYFQVYESDRSGVGRQTKTGGTDDNWQNARTLKSYQPDIEQHFGKVESKDGMLIASEPKDPGPVEWQLNKAGDTVREARGLPDSDYPFIIEYAGKKWIGQQDANNKEITHFLSDDGAIASEAAELALKRLERMSYNGNVAEAKNSLLRDIKWADEAIESIENDLRDMKENGWSTHPDTGWDESTLRDHLATAQKTKALSTEALNFLEQSDTVQVESNVSLRTAIHNNRLPDNLRRLFTTPEEKKLLAALDSSWVDSNYLDNVMQPAMQVILDKLPGLRTKKASLYMGADSQAFYNDKEGAIYVNVLENAGTASGIIENMNHEIGHASQREIGNPSTNTFINTEAYANASPATRSDIDFLYNRRSSLERDPRARDADFYGEEIYAYLLTGEMPFDSAESVRGAILDIYGSKANNKRTQLYSQAMSFFAQHADQGTYNEFVKAAINSSKEHVEMFTSDNIDSIQNPLARQMVQDYRSAAREANVPLNTETLGDYLDAVLDHDTSLNVWKRQSMPC